MKWTGTIISCIVAIALMAACNNSGGGGESNSAKTDSGDLSMNSYEIGFMRQAANGGMTEVALGKAAEKHAKNKRVKDFGEMIVQDHTSANSQLKTIALNEHVTLPDSLSEDSENEVERISRMQGNDFDKAFTQTMLQDHEKAVAGFKRALDSVQNTILKEWISNTLPILEKHLDSARAINSMYGAGSSSSVPGKTAP